MKLCVYEYPITDKYDTYVVSYTIKEGVKPFGYEGEKLVQTFESNYLEKEQEEEKI